MYKLLGAVVALFVVAFKGNAVPERYELFVGSHAFYEELTDSLMPRIRHRAAFRCYARRLDLAGSFKPGHYVLEPGMSVIEVARMFRPLSAARRRTTRRQRASSSGLRP